MPAAPIPRGTTSLGNAHVLLYRILLTIAAPVIALKLALRILRKQGTRADLRERLGLGGPPVPPRGQILWLHGASNGELTSARPLIEALLARNPDLRIVLTANSITGRNMARGWGLPRLHARLAPLDYRFCLNRFLKSHAPSAFLLLEGDLWPNRFEVARRRDLSILMISARISEGSFRTWRRLPGLSRRMMRSVTLLSAQDAASERRFVDLGLPKTALAGQVTLKSSVSLAAPTPDALAPFQEVFRRDETFLAASTHEGEEEQVLAAFTRARATRPDLKMILAPRHTARSAAVRQLLDASGYRFRTRSLGEMPAPETEIFLADTLGEMALWYSLAGQCFVGGSLVDKGGHTPFEPMQFGCAILQGPFLSNFAEPYAALAQAGGSIAVPDAEALGDAIAGLDSARIDQLTASASRALTTGEDSIEALLAAVERLLTRAAAERPVSQPAGISS